MSDLSQALGLSASGMAAQAQRLRHISENISNQDTPGYRRKLIAFDQDSQTGYVSASAVKLDRTALERIYDPSHPLADAEGYYNGSNVDLVIEIADAREAQRSYEANLKLFDQARQMTQSIFDLLRK